MTTYLRRIDTDQDLVKHMDSRVVAEILPNDSNARNLLGIEHVIGHVSEILIRGGSTVYGTDHSGVHYRLHHKEKSVLGQHIPTKDISLEDYVKLSLNDDVVWVE